jgi:integrase
MAFAKRWPNGVIKVRYKLASGKWTGWLSTPYKKLSDAERFAEQKEVIEFEVASGLREAPMEAAHDFAWLHTWWWERYGRKHRARKKKDFDAMFQNRVLRYCGNVALSDLTPMAVLEALKKNEERQPMLRADGKPELGEDGNPRFLEPVGSKTLNELRSRISTIIQRASVRGGPWRGAPNPISRYEVPRWKSGKKTKDTLAPDEVGPMLSALDPDWRPLFATALWMALRKGELSALLKTDIRLSPVGAEQMNVSKSWDNDETKSGDEAVLPIPAPLIPYLRAALEVSTGDHVFPGITEDTKLQMVLRRALARADLTKGWVHGCRRCKARGNPHTEDHPDSEIRRCPRCSMKLWPKPIYRSIDFHGLRRTTATLLMKAKVPPGIVQRICRHADIKVTMNIYTQVDLQDMRDGMNSMLTAETHGPSVVQGSKTSKTKAPDSVGFPNESEAFKWSGRQDSNLRPLGPENIERGSQGLAGSGLQSQALDIQTDGVQADALGANASESKSQIHGPSVVQKKPGKAKTTSGGSGQQRNAPAVIRARRSDAAYTAGDSPPEPEGGSDGGDL